MNRIDEIKRRLAVLLPTQLHLIDDSAKHAGHTGAQHGGHYQLTIVSEAFAGKLPIARHRMIYAELEDLMQNGIHALNIQAYTPQEFSTTQHKE